MNRYFHPWSSIKPRRLVPSKVFPQFFTYRDGIWNMIKIIKPRKERINPRAMKYYYGKHREAKDGL